MERIDTAKCYMLVCAAFNMEPRDEAIEAWHLLLGDLPGVETLEATRLLCLTDRDYPPRPGQIRAETNRLTGNDEPPSVGAATGLYMAGRWDAHPLVEKAARKVQWDRLNAPEEAKWEFRSLYEAALWDDDQGVRREQRAEIAGQGRLEIL